MHLWAWTLHSFVLILTSTTLGNGESEGDPIGIIYSKRESVVKIDLESPERSTVIVDGQANAVAVDYDMERKLVVWSDVRTKRIYTANIETGGNRTVLASEGVVTPDGLAVDWIQGNVYWTDTGADTISVASLDGSMRKLLFSEDIDEPRAIVVNPLDGWMYWTDWGAQAKIERSGMDGTRRSTIVSEKIGVPNGLAIDFESRKLFWVDVRLHSLSCSDYDGGNSRVILVSFTRLGHPFAVDVFQDWLYWTDWRSHSVTKVNKITGESLQQVTTGFHLFPMGLRVYHSTKQPKGRKSCREENAQCLYLCLPAPADTTGSKNYTCACPDGKDCTVTGVVTMRSTFPSTTKQTTFYPSTAERRISTTTTTNTIASTSLAAVPSQSKLQSDSIDKLLHEIHENVNYCGKFAGIIFGMFVFLIILISVVGFCAYKQNLRVKIGGLSFVNPVYRKNKEDAVKLESGAANDPPHSPLI